MDKLTAEACAHVRDNIAAFTVAGAWLDEHYSAAALAQRGAQTWPPNAGPPPVAGAYSPLKRLGRAVADLLEVGRANPLALPSREEAERVLLVAFLLCAPDASRVEPPVTDLQRLEGGGVPDSLARLCTDELVSEPEAWNSLVEQAWAVVQPTAPASAATTPTLITAAVAAQRYYVNAQTIGEAVRDGRLTDHRPEGHAPNAPHRVDEAEVGQLWPRRAAPN